jgi:hypothetical protein
MGGGGDNTNSANSISNVRAMNSDSAANSPGLLQDTAPAHCARTRMLHARTWPSASSQNWSTSGRGACEASTMAAKVRSKVSRAWSTPLIDTSLGGRGGGGCQRRREATTTATRNPSRPHAQHTRARAHLPEVRAHEAGGSGQRARDQALDLHRRSSGRGGSDRAFKAPGAAQHTRAPAPTIAPRSSTLFSIFSPTGPASRNTACTRLSR